mgnify:CR=1 FL=1
MQRLYFIIFTALPEMIRTAGSFSKVVFILFFKAFELPLRLHKCIYAAP